VVETTSAQWTHEIMRARQTILLRLQTYLGPGTVSEIEVRTNTNLHSAQIKTRSL
jgi:hypothetical protein